MDKDDKQLSQMKYKLNELKKRRVKSVIWKLTNKQREYIEEKLGYEVIPFLYEIKTKTFKDFSSLPNSKLKEIHCLNKRGKKTIVRSLKHGDIRVLEQYNVRFRPVEFEIFLTS